MDDHFLGDGEIPLKQHITYPLSRLNANLTAQANRLLQKHSTLSLAQWRLVVFLASRGPVKLSDFIRFSGFDKGQMSRIARDLTKAGLVQSQPAKDDNRASLLSLTEEGMKAYQQALPHMRKRREYLINSLTQEERETYFKLLSKLDGAVKEYEDEI